MTQDVIFGEHYLHTTMKFMRWAEMNRYTVLMLSDLAVLRLFKQFLRERGDK
jgi:hypothetical protein